MNDPKPPEPRYAPQSKLATVYFHGSVMFAGAEMNSASVGTTAGNAVDSILPAVLLPDGSARVATVDDGRTDGLLLRKRRHEQHTNRRIVAQTLVPWANVKSVGYAGE